MSAACFLPLEVYRSWMEGSLSPVIPSVVLIDPSVCVCPDWWQTRQLEIYRKAQLRQFKLPELVQEVQPLQGFWDV